MKPIISCKFNMDTACVELKFLDGTMLSIDTIAVEDEVAANMYERAEQANREVQIRLLLELVDEMVKNSLPEWMSREAEAVEETGACRDYDDFFNRTRYTVPEGVLDENGRMEAFNNDLVIRYLDRVVVKDDGYEVAFKAGVTVEVEV